MGDPTVPRPLLLGRATHNTVRFDDASYIKLIHLEIDGRDLGGDGIKAQGVAQHTILDGLTIRRVANSQQTVGINTKAPCWNWIVRNCTIDAAGTGMYFGDSDGSDPFIAGLIENNYVFNTIGYSMQIKHQAPRLSIPVFPPERM